MSTDLNETLAGMRAKTDAATKGPWEDDGSNVAQLTSPYDDITPRGVSCMSYCYGGSPEPMKKADREFIAMARTTMPALLSAVQNVLALHTPETRYTALGYDECSFDTAEEAREYSDDGDVNTFTVCAHCGHIEMSADSDRDYRDSTWPCATYKALTDALEGGK